MLPVQVRSFYDYLTIDLYKYSDRARDLHSLRTDRLPDSAAGRMLDQAITKYEVPGNQDAEATARKRFISNIDRARAISNRLNSFFGASLGSATDDLYGSDVTRCPLCNGCNPCSCDLPFSNGDPFGRKPHVMLDSIVESASYDIWRLFYNSEYEPNYYNIADRIGLGTGSNLCALGTTYLGKLFAKPLSSTSTGLVNLFRSMCSHSTLAYAFPRDWDVIVPGSQVTFVPKTLKTHRVVCTEPTVNMLLQKGLAGCLREGLRKWGINFENQQEINRALCKRASVDGSLATIDLSDASDCITSPLVRKLCYFFKWFEITRSPVLCIDDVKIESDIFCTMGNDWTFPLQTLIFLSLARSVCRHLDIASHDVSVFGDDIIIPTNAAPLMLCVLENLGFLPNKKKTFVSGPFRESCGVEYLCGYDIRPVYIKALETLGDFYSVYNRLNVWSHKHGIPVPETLLYLRKLIKKKNWYTVPPTEPDNSGIWDAEHPLTIDENGHEVTVCTSYIPKRRVFTYDRLVELGFTPAQLYNVFLHGSLRTPEYCVGWPKTLDNSDLSYPDLYRKKLDVPRYSHAVVKRYSSSRKVAGLRYYNPLGIDYS